MDSGDRGAGRRGARRSACALALACALFAWTLPAAAQVAVVVRVPEDSEIARQLRQLIDVQVDEHKARGAQDGLGAIMEQASGAWSATYAVVIDRPADAAHVLRLADKTVASRVLAPELIAESPYAVALTLAELLEWLGAVPPARPLAPPPVDEGAAIGLGTEDAAPAEPAQWGIAFGVDLEVTTSLGSDLTLVRPAIGAGVQWGRAQRSPWFAVGARLAAPAHSARPIEPAGSGVTEVEYGSVDPALDAELGIGTAAGSLVGQLAFGLSIVEVEARGADGSTLTERETVIPWLGLGVGLRYALFSGLSLAVAAEGQWLLDRGRYRVDNVPVLEEGRLRLATRFGLIWESGR